MREGSGWTASGDIADTADGAPLRAAGQPVTYERDGDTHPTAQSGLLRDNVSNMRVENCDSETHELR